MRVKLLSVLIGIVSIFIACKSPVNDTEYLQINKNKLLHHLETADALLLEKATLLLQKDPVLITNKSGFHQISDKRTYVSLACYWWPNPSTEDGLPYIRIDGEINPETRGASSDLPKLIEASLRIELLTAAYLSSGDEQFALKITEQLYYWFADHETAMLPHLEHAQMIKGLNEGRSFGIIDTWWLVRVVESIPALRQSIHWTEDLERHLQNWFTHYLNWLRNSEFGKQEMRSKNNHGTWYDVQVVTFSMFVDQRAYAEHHLNKISVPRLSKQIMYNGRQQYEIRRPRPVFYSIYNLSGWLKLALIAEEFNITLDFHNQFWAGDIKDAIHYLNNLMTDQPVLELSDPFDRTDIENLYLNLLIDAWRLYRNPDYKLQALQFFSEIKTVRVPIISPANKEEISYWVNYQ